MKAKPHKEDACEVSVKKTYSGDVVVAGGGMAGVSAALAAADAGADAILVERYGFLGGTATAAAVASFQPGPDVKGEPVIRGVYERIRGRTEASGGIENGRRFDPEILKLVLFDLCAERGVRLLLHTFLCDAQVDDAGQIQSALIATKLGHCQVKGDIFVDASGDGDLAAFAGAEFQYGRPEDSRVQPMTLQFQICGVDSEKIKQANYNDLWPQFVKETGVTTSRGRIMPRSSAGGSKLIFNMTHVNDYDGLDVEEMAKAEHLGRKQASAILQFFRRWVPGCEKAVFASTGVQIGVRETRRIRGDYEMTRVDVLGAKHFDDAVGRSTSWIDIHSPTGVGVLHEHVPEDQWFEIPYRALLPQGLRNLYVVGRCMSVTHEALGALREMPTCSLTGEAAGIAAALCVQNKCETRELDMGTLQDELEKRGVSLARQPGSDMESPIKQTKDQVEQTESEDHSAMMPLPDLFEKVVPYFNAELPEKTEISDGETRLRLCVTRGLGGKPIFDQSFSLGTAQKIIRSIPEEYRREFRLRSIDFGASLQVAALLHNVTSHRLIDYQEVSDQLKLYVTT